MKTSSLLTLSALAVASLAKPIENAAAASEAAQDVNARVGSDDFNVLTFALTLEHLETAFYASALAKFQKSDYADAAQYNNVVRLYRDEAAHVDKISSVFKAANRAVPGPCKYNFPFNSTKEFLKIASVIEGVGVSAYAGAAPYVKNKDVLKAAAAILPIEARHDAVLRLAVDVPPYASAFDVPLSFQQVWSLASQFIVKGSCPQAVAALGLKAFPALTLVQNASSTTVTANATITMEADIAALKSTRAASAKHRRHESLHCRSEETADRVRAMYLAFLTADGATTVDATISSGVITAKVPDGVYGQTYVVLTTSKSGVTDRTTLAGPAIVEIADNVTLGAAADPVTIIPVKGNSASVDGDISASASVDVGDNSNSESTS